MADNKKSRTPDTASNAPPKGKASRRTGRTATTSGPGPATPVKSTPAKSKSVRRKTRSVAPETTIATSAGQFSIEMYPDAPDFRDWKYEPALIELQPEIKPPADLIILDQGQEGACTGYGLAAVINCLCQKSARDFSASEVMLYDMARRYDAWAGEDYEGSSCRGAIEGWYNMWVCGVEDW